jgi:hypothetical protein
MQKFYNLSSSNPKESEGVGARMMSIKRRHPPSHQDGQHFISQFTHSNYY